MSSRIRTVLRRSAIGIVFASRSAGIDIWGGGSAGGGVTREEPALLHWMEPSRDQQRLALMVSTLLLCGLCLAAPLAGLRFSRLDSFIPIVDTILIFNDAITAVIIFSLFSILRMRGLLALGSGYLFTALMTIPHALTFPGAFGESGLLHAGMQTNAYLYIFWHAGLPLGAILYAMLMTDTPDKKKVPVLGQRPIFVSVALVILVVAALSWLTIVNDRVLPPIMIDSVHSNGGWLVVGPCILAFEATAIWLVWRRFHSVLDMWLMVALWAWFIEILLLSTTNYRFSLAWYAGRLYGVFAGSVVLAALIAQSTMLYARLVVSLSAQARERENRLQSVDAMMTLVAHEIRQPLSAIILNGQAGLAEMGSLKPNLGELHAICEDIVADGHRVGDIVGSLKTAIKQGQRIRESVDLKALIDEVLDFLGAELRHRKVKVVVKLHPTASVVFANRKQLRQVLVNLVTNAIEAMEGTKAQTLIVRTCGDEKGVVVEVEDRGPGVDLGAAQFIFDTFFTTKTKGTGLGLSVSRMIVEDHGGRLSTKPAYPHGAIFRLSLPVGEPV